MLIINGTDYTLYLVAVGSMALLFIAQFFLCRRAKGLFPRLLPLGFVAALVVIAVAIQFTEPSGFLDLRNGFTLLFLGYAALCAVAIGLGWLFGRQKGK